MLGLETYGAGLPDLLTTLKLAREVEGKKDSDDSKFPIALITNFTDDLLRKSIIGVTSARGINPDLYTVPFKQYFFELKNEKSKLYTHKAGLTFVFFDINPYVESEFGGDPNHLAETLDDLERYIEKTVGVVVIALPLSPNTIQSRRLFAAGSTRQLVEEFTKRVRAFALKYTNVHVLATDPIAVMLGVDKTRDFRGMYAFHQPFHNDFLHELALECVAYVESITGRVRKCLVLDLDNTLWGGVVGETGPAGIQLGPDYPGSAYVAFQKVLLEYYKQGVILAINSRNNIEDVMEVFEKNKYMVLKEEHFASIIANWNNKAENLELIAEELNIGLDSMVFIDDDAMNRDLVRTQLPQVVVPEFSLPPEEYANAILNLHTFHTLKLTEEDKKRGAMYAAERSRRKVRDGAGSTADYMASLDIQVDISVNDTEQIPRLAQMTQKTNQFNLTTLRATETDVTSWIEGGSLVYAGDVRDKFGSYGITILYAFEPDAKDEKALHLKVCLMSCRVMGRGVEHAFFKAVAGDLAERGYGTVHAEFIPTQKNKPSAGYLSEIGGEKTVEHKDGTVEYTIDIGNMKKKEVETFDTITCNLIKN